MFRFDFRDKSLIPPILGTDNADYLERLMPVLERERIHPSGVVRLRDAAFCEERGIVQLSSSAEHTALLENDDYKRLGHRFGMDGDVVRQLGYGWSVLGKAKRYGSAYIRELPA